MAAMETPTDDAQEPNEGVLRRMVKGFNIGHLLVIIFALHLFALSFPSDTSNGGGLVFDEAYYVPASLDLLHGVANNLEHPFFGKVWGALGIAIFGDNFFGWRIFYAVIGTLSVWMMYELARRFFSKELALLAASMLAFENLFFIHTSLLLLDGPPVLFALAGFLAYFKGRYYLSALAFGLSILSKETGVFFLLALVLYHLWANGKRLRMPGSPIGLKRVAVFALILALVVGVPLWGYDLAYHPYAKTTVVVQPIATVDVTPIANITTTTTTTKTVGSDPVTNPIQNFEFYYTYQSSLTGCGSVNEWNCYPWSWILPFNVAPLPYYVTSADVPVNQSGGATLETVVHPIDWLGIGNLVVWYSIWLIVPVLVWKAVKGSLRQVDALVAAVIAGTYLPLFYISLVSHRVEYSFYFINTDVGLALGIPMVVAFAARGRVQNERLLAVLWLVAAVTFFFIYFPVNPFAFRS